MRIGQPALEVAPTSTATTPLQRHRHLSVGTGGAFSHLLLPAQELLTSSWIRIVQRVQCASYRSTGEASLRIGLSVDVKVDTTTRAARPGSPAATREAASQCHHQQQLARPTWPQSDT